MLLLSCRCARGAHCATLLAAYSPLLTTYSLLLTTSHSPAVGVCQFCNVLRALATPEPAQKTALESTTPAAIHDTRTSGKLHQHSLTLSGSDPATERWDVRPSQTLRCHKPATRHTHTRARRARVDSMVDFVSGTTPCTDQRNSVSAQYLGTNPKPGPGRRTAPIDNRLQAS